MLLASACTGENILLASFPEYSFWNRQRGSVWSQWHWCKSKVPAVSDWIMLDSQQDNEIRSWSTVITLFCSRHMKFLCENGRDCRYKCWPWLLLCFTGDATVCGISLCVYKSKNPPDLCFGSGAVGHGRWWIVGGLLGQPQQDSAGGSGSPAHSMGSRQPSKAWQKIDTISCCNATGKSLINKSSISYIFSALQSSLHQKFSSDCFPDIMHLFSHIWYMG